MVQLAPQDREMLAQAIAKARDLVAELEKEHREFEASPSKLSAARLAEGKQFLANAIISARRTLAALKEAHHE